jgi:hypothetical protein
MIIWAGANVIMTTKGIDDIASKYMVEGKCIGYTKIIKIFKGLKESQNNLVLK